MVLYVKSIQVRKVLLEGLLAKPKQAAWLTWECKKTLQTNNHKNTTVQLYKDTQALPMSVSVHDT